MTPLLVALGAFVGTPLRHLCGTWLDAERWPWGTLAVNVTGSFVLGLLAGAAVEGRPAALLGVGFCGGLTTYSSFSVQTHRLGPRRGTAYAVATVGGALAACALGWAVGQA